MPFRSVLLSVCSYLSLQVVVNTFSEAVKKEMEKAVADGVNSFIVDVDSEDKLYQVGPAPYSG